MVTVHWESRLMQLLGSEGPDVVRERRERVRRQEEMNSQPWQRH